MAVLGSGEPCASAITGEMVYEVVSSEIGLAVRVYRRGPVDYEVVLVDTDADGVVSRTRVPSMSKAEQLVREMALLTPACRLCGGSAAVHSPESGLHLYVAPDSPIAAAWTAEDDTFDRGGVGVRLSERFARLEVDLVLAIGREPTAEIIAEALRLERLVRLGRRYQKELLDLRDAVSAESASTADSVAKVRAMRERLRLATLTPETR